MLTPPPLFIVGLNQPLAELLNVSIVDAPATGHSARIKLAKVPIVRLVFTVFSVCRGQRRQTPARPALPLVRL
jgi:hypothetical protein